jgi:hypothetical protein
MSTYAARSMNGCQTAARRAASARFARRHITQRDFFSCRHMHLHTFRYKSQFCRPWFSYALQKLMVKLKPRLVFAGSACVRTARSTRLVVLWLRAHTHVAAVPMWWWQMHVAPVAWLPLPATHVDRRRSSVFNQCQAVGEESHYRVQKAVPRRDRVRQKKSASHAATVNDVMAGKSREQ